jgi:hypothetical protein
MRATIGLKSAALFEQRGNQSRQQTGIAEGVAGCARAKQLFKGFFHNQNHCGVIL